MAELEPMTYGVNNSRSRNVPIWTNRYRPSFVARTASENRRRALVDYLAVAAGTKVNSEDFPIAVRQDKESRLLQRQRCRKPPTVQREQTETSLSNPTHLNVSPPPTAATTPSVFLTQIPTDYSPTKLIASNSFCSGKFSFLRSPRPPSPPANLICSPQPNNTQFISPQKGNASVNAANDNLKATSVASTSPTSEPYFSQWRKEFWSTEASKRGKIMYFQVASPVPLTSRPGGFSPVTPRRERTIDIDSKPIEVGRENASIAVKSDAKAELNNGNDKQAKNGKAEFASEEDAKWKDEYPAVEVVFENADGSFPLSYVDLRPISASVHRTNSNRSINENAETGNEGKPAIDETPVDSELVDEEQRISASLNDLSFSANDNAPEENLGDAVVDEDALQQLVESEGQPAVDDGYL